MGISDYIHLFLPQDCHLLVNGFVLHGHSTDCVTPGTSLLFLWELSCFLFVVACLVIGFC